MRIGLWMSPTLGAFVRVNELLVHYPNHGDPQRRDEGSFRGGGRCGVRGAAKHNSLQYFLNRNPETRKKIERC